jgi:hypothetical protein
MGRVRGVRHLRYNGRHPNLIVGGLSAKPSLLSLFLSSFSFEQRYFSSLHYLTSLTFISQVIVTSPSGTETLELADQELLIVSTNEAERQLALAKYNEIQDAMIVNHTSRSKSKSPRRSRPEREDAIPPSPGVPSSYHRSKSSSRRPHTSAGPRDKPVNFAGGAYEHPRAHDGEASGRANSSEGNGEGSSNATPAATKRRSDGAILRTTRPDRVWGSANGLIGGSKNSMSLWSTVHSNGVSPPRVKDVPSGSSTSTTASSSSLSSSSYGGAESDLSDHVKEWEEELARIEIRSRHSSDLLGFSGRRKRPTGVPRVTTAIPGLDT